MRSQEQCAARRVHTRKDLRVRCSRIPIAAILISLVGALNSACVHPPRTVNQAPETWVVASPSDTMGDMPRSTERGMPVPSTLDLAEIRVIGDSLTVMVVDPAGRSTTWDSWAGQRPGGQIPRCARGDPPAYDDYTGERESSVLCSLASPADGTYRIRIIAHRAGHVHLSVQRRGGRRVDSASVSRDRNMAAGEHAKWSTSWSPHDDDFSWVDLREGEVGK